MKSALMVWGTTSDAGKSLLTTALCRWAWRQGMKVAPFKAQNMSNNARVAVAPDGTPGEIGSAQYFQALAAETPPHVDMNPVLLKPERDTASQVVICGQVDPTLSTQGWRERAPALAAAARTSFDRLAAQHDLIVIEGAGSPAEINLAAQDYVNLDTARWARAVGDLQAVLVCDIDRGGSFAQLFGTWALLPDDLRDALSGFVLNKFRGDASLLAPGPERLEQMTGVPTLGVIPMIANHGLPEEDGITSENRFRFAAGQSARDQSLRVAILYWPHISNLDEFQSLSAAVNITWISGAENLDTFDWIILPGSKQVSGDLDWLRKTGLDKAITRHAQTGKPVLGICGGLQILGRSLDDPHGVDGQAHGPVPGLNLLALSTRYAAPKQLLAKSVRFAQTSGPWRRLSGLQFPAYEIRCGVTTPVEASCRAVLFDSHGTELGWQAGTVIGLSTHGLFENSETMQALFDAHGPTLSERFDRLADELESALGNDQLRAITQT